MDEILKTQFYGDFNAGGLASFKRYLKDKNIDIPNNVVTTFYNKQALNQKIKLPKKRTEFNPIFTLNGHGSVLYMDTMFLTFKTKTKLKKKVAVITAMDLFSKYLYIYIKLLKQSQGGLEIGTSVKTKDSEALLDDIFKKTTYQEIRTDGGSEFKFKNPVYKKIHKSFIDDTHRLLSPIERTNYSIRLLYEKYILIHPKEFDLNKIFYDIQLTYNNVRIHSLTNLTPEEGRLDSNFEYIKQRIFDKQKRIEKKKINKGTKVRLLMKRDILNKLKPRWTQRIYTIDKYDDIINRYSFPHTKRLYSDDEIQIIAEDTVDDIVDIIEENIPEPPRPKRRRRIPARLRE